MIDWGQQFENQNEKRQQELKVHINQEFEMKYKAGQKKRFAPSKQALSLDIVDFIQKSLFEKMF